jgi:hypothetical protein
MSPTAIRPQTPRTEPTSRAGTLFVVRGIVTLLIFLGISAVAGGVMMLLDVSGGRYVPAYWLDEFPLIDSFLVPGLVLLLGFGAGSLITAYGVLRRPRWTWLNPVERMTGRHWSSAATIMLGAGQVLWISLELIYLPGVAWLQVVYGATGLGLMLLPLTASARRYLRAR